MSNLEAAGRVALWAIELSEFGIQYRPHSAIKGQVVTDFIVEFTNRESQEVEVYPRWSVHTDGSSNWQAGEAGIVLRSPEGWKLNAWFVSTFLLLIMKQSMKL